MLTSMKGEINSNTIIVGDLAAEHIHTHTLLSTRNRSPVSGTDNSRDDTHVIWRLPNSNICNSRLKKRFDSAVVVFFLISSSSP